MRRPWGIFFNYLRTEQREPGQARRTRTTRSRVQHMNHLSGHSPSQTWNGVTKLQLREGVETGRSQQHNSINFVVFMPEWWRKPETKAVQNFLPHPQSDWALNQKQLRPRLSRSQQVVRSCRSWSERASLITPVRIYWPGSLKEANQKQPLTSK